MPPPEDSKWRRVERFAISVRDLGLVILGLVVVFGVAFRSVHAYNFGLGFFPGNNIQFVTAGIGPVLLLLGVAGAIVIVRRLARMLKEWVSAIDKRPKWLFQHVPAWLVELLAPWAVYFMLALGITSVVWWAFDYYPGVPQAFGGPAPRCAVLFAKATDVPNQLIPVVFRASTSTTLATDEIDMYWESRNGYVIRVHAEGGYQGYEIAYNIVSAVRWC